MTATALIHDLIVVTHNTADFDDARRDGNQSMD